MKASYLMKLKAHSAYMQFETHLLIKRSHVIMASKCFKLTSNLQALSLQHSQWPKYYINDCYEI